MRIQSRCDKRPHLIEHIGKRDQERTHHGDFHRHEKWSRDISRDHLPAFRQNCEQRMRQERVQVPCKRKQRDKNHHNSDHGMQQALA